MMQNPEFVVNPELMAKRQAGYDLIIDDGVEIQRLMQSLTAGEMTKEEYEAAQDILFDRVLLDMAEFDRRTGPQSFDSL